MDSEATPAKHNEARLFIRLHFNNFSELLLAWAMEARKVIISSVSVKSSFSEKAKNLKKKSPTSFDTTEWKPW